MVPAEGIEQLISDCQRQLELNLIQQRDSLVGEVLRVIDTYGALIRYGEGLAGRIDRLLQISHWSPCVRFAEELT